MKLLTTAILTTVFTSSILQAAIYEDDFSSAPTIVPNPNGFGTVVLGGASPTYNLGEYASGRFGDPATQGARWDNADLNMDLRGTGGNQRSMSVAFDASAMAAGDYSLQFDLADGTTGAGFFAAVWALDGFDATNGIIVSLNQYAEQTTGNAFYRPDTGSTATANLLASDLVPDITTGTSASLNFSLTGNVDAVGIAFSRFGGGLMTIDNLSVVPEPASVALLGSALIGLLVATRVRRK